MEDQGVLVRQVPRRPTEGGRCPVHTDQGRASADRKATWTADAWKRYATGEGGASASVNPDESASLQCANFPRFGAVRMPPSGRAPTAECVDSNSWGCTVPSKGFNNGMRFGGIGLIALGIVLFVIQVIVGRNAPATGKMYIAK